MQISSLSISFLSKNGSPKPWRTNDFDTIEKFVIDYPKNKLIKKANLQLNDYGCLDDKEWN